MMKKSIKFLLIFLLIIMLFNVKVLANEDVLYINSVDDYLGFANNLKAYNNYKGMTIELTTDLDFEGSETNPTPMVKGDFEGVFDGNGHEFKNIYLVDPEEHFGIGLFEKNKGIIRKIIVRSGYIASEHGAASICADNEGLIEQCANYVDINCGYQGGGICRWNRAPGVIRYCYNQGNISDVAPGGGGTIGFGGIVGFCYSGDILDCYNTGIIAPERDEFSKGNIAGFFYERDDRHTEDCFYLLNNKLENDENGAFFGISNFNSETFFQRVNDIGEYYIFKDGAEYPELDMNLNINDDITKKFTTNIQVEESVQKEDIVQTEDIVSNEEIVKEEKVELSVAPIDNSSAIITDSEETTNENRKVYYKYNKEEFDKITDENKKLQEELDVIEERVLKQRMISAVILGIFIIILIIQAIRKYYNMLINY